MCGFEREQFSSYSARTFDLCRRRKWLQLERLCETDPLCAELHSDGGYPLHLACKYQPPLRVVRALLRAFPDAASLSNENGDYPLHEACQFNASISVIRCLTNHTPSAAAVSPSPIATLFNARESTETNMKTSNSAVTWHVKQIDLQPINYSSMFWQKIQVLLEAVATHRRRSQAQNTDSMLILHAAVSLQCCPTDVLQYCLDQYPHQISEPDDCGRLPLHIAAAITVDKTQDSILQKRQHRERSVIVRLMEAHPQASQVMDPNEPRGRFPLHTALVSGHGWNDGVKELAQHCPACLSLPDPVRSLFPFQMAAHDQCSVFQLLRMMPSELENTRGCATEETASVMSNSGTARLTRCHQQEETIMVQNVVHQTERKGAPDTEDLPSSRVSSPMTLSHDSMWGEVSQRPPQANSRISKPRKVAPTNTIDEQSKTSNLAARDERGKETARDDSIDVPMPDTSPAPNNCSIRGGRTQTWAEVNLAQSLEPTGIASRTHSTGMSFMLPATTYPESKRNARYHKYKDLITVEKPTISGLDDRRKGRYSWRRDSYKFLRSLFN